MKIKLLKFTDTNNQPVREHYNDSGADCFAAKTTIIRAKEVTKVPTGVGVELPDGYDIVIHCKSGLASRGIFTLNAPIDAGYRGEIYAIMYNAGNEDYLVRVGEKIGQFVVRPVIYADFVYDLGDERGTNGFGSTGMK